MQQTITDPNFTLKIGSSFFQSVR